VVRELVGKDLEVNKLNKIETQVRVDGKLKYTITKATYSRPVYYDVTGLGPRGTVRQYSTYKGALKAIEKAEGV